MNQNTGKAPMIPIGTAGTPVAPAVTSPSVEKIKVAASRQAAAAAQTATFHTPTPAPPARSAAAHSGPGRPRSNIAPTRLKGVYFDPSVYDALLTLQKRGQNVSKYINNIVRQSLAI